MSPPSRDVLGAFGSEAAARALPGGEGRSWRTDDVVFKKVHDPQEARWCQEVLAVLVEDGFRRPEPIPAIDGRWVVDGWTACAFIEGLRDGRPRWADILAGGARFHRAIPAPNADTRRVLGQRKHRWAVADRVAWGEATIAVSAAASSLHDRILERLAPLELPDQLIHGDLSGNVLFDANDTPVVIDFSPYLRLAKYADAIVVGDAMLWEGAGPEVLDLLGHDELNIQLLARALVFRLVAEQLATRPRHLYDLQPYKRALDWLDL